MGIFIFILALAIIIFVARAVYRFFARKSSVQEKGKQTSTSIHPLWRIVGEVLAVSFVSSVLIGGYTLLLIFITSLLKVVATHEFEYIFMLFLVLISCAVYALFLFGPVVYMGLKRGFWRSAITLAATVGWLVFYFFIFMVLFVMYRVYPNSGYYGTPVPMPMMQSTESNFVSPLK